MLELLKMDCMFVLKFMSYAIQYKCKIKLRGMYEKVSFWNVGAGLFVMDNRLFIG